MAKKQQKEKIEGKKITENIYLCEDGKYRWTYEFNMLKNPVILFTVWKVLSISFFVVYAFAFIMDVIGNGFELEDFISLTRGFGLLWLFFLFLGVIAYLIVAHQYGKKYLVIFEMDEEGILHRQMKQQFDKARAMGWITAAAGLATGNITLAGSGVLAATRDSLSTDFRLVKNVKAIKRRNTIYVNAPFSNNQVYAEGEDYDFVLEYILARVPGTAKVKVS